LLDPYMNVICKWSGLNMSQVTDKLYHMMLYWLHLATLVVVGTVCITYLIVFGLTRPVLLPTIYRRGEHTNIRWSLLCRMWFRDKEVFLVLFVYIHEYSMCLFINLLLYLLFAWPIYECNMQMIRFKYVASHRQTLSHDVVLITPRHFSGLINIWKSEVTVVCCPQFLRFSNKDTNIIQYEELLWS
jgi:hypothetical protein